MKIDIKFGAEFGSWTVIKKSEKTRDSIEGDVTYYECRCTCGKVIDVLFESLIEGLSLSCGCKRLKRRKELDIGMQFGSWKIQNSYFDIELEETIYSCLCMECDKEVRATNSRIPIILDKACECNRGNAAFIIGKRYGNWTIIGEGSKENARSSEQYYKCQCDCGEIRDVVNRSLKRMISTSCGCSRILSQKEVYKIIPPPAKIKYYPEDVLGVWRIVKKTTHYAYCECMNCKFLYRSSAINKLSQTSCPMCALDHYVMKETLLVHIRQQYSMKSLEECYFSMLDYRNNSKIFFRFYDLTDTQYQGTIYCIDKNIPNENSNKVIISPETENIIRNLRGSYEDHEIFLNKDILHPLLASYSLWEMAKILIEGYIVEKYILILN